MGGTLFHSELVAHRNKSISAQDSLVLRAEDVSHYFSFPHEQALHQFNLQAEGGHLVGIMGGSGSGKSTLLDVLNGSTKPSFGSVTINGVDIHDSRNVVAGLIGHVPQEDVLISELTVRQNLTFNAQLSLGALSTEDQKPESTRSSPNWAFGTFGICVWGRCWTKSSQAVNESASTLDWNCCATASLVPRRTHKWTFQPRQRANLRPAPKN